MGGTARTLAGSLTIDAIRDAARVLAGRIHRTPLLRCAAISRRAGCEVFLKAENWQKTGSFKPRGALNRIARLSAEERGRGVLAASAGNHAQGLAFAAAASGTPVRVVMPANAPAAKIEATRSMGAEIILHGAIYDDALERALEIAAGSGMTYVHPNTDPAVVAGAGTIGLEIVEDLPEVDAVVVPVGGGGLLSGVATALRALAPEARLYGVNPDGAPAMARAFRERRPVVLDRAFSIADGMAGRAAVPETLEILLRLVDDVVEVSDVAIVEAILLMLTRAKILAEGAGAGPLAALLERRIPVAPQDRVVCVVSGGNLDLARLARWIREGPERAPS